MTAVSVFLFLVWLAFAVFTLYFFRDPNAKVPAGAGLVVSPGHGKVDVIDTLTEPQYHRWRLPAHFDVLIRPGCPRAKRPRQRQGHLFEIHRRPISQCHEDRMRHVQRKRATSAFEATEPPGEKIGVRLIAGVIARRIVPWVEPGDELARGDRISLIQFGSRVDVYLPIPPKYKVKIGDRIVGGETVLAVLD